MAKKKFTLTSDEAVQRWAPGAEIGEQIELDLNPDETRALVAAGWLEEPPEPKGKKKEE